MCSAFGENDPDSGDASAGTARGAGTPGAAPAVLRPQCSLLPQTPTLLTRAPAALAQAAGRHSAGVHSQDRALASSSPGSSRGRRGKRRGQERDRLALGRFSWAGKAPAPGLARAAATARPEPRAQTPTVLLPGAGAQPHTPTLPGAALSSHITHHAPGCGSSGRTGTRAPCAPTPKPGGFHTQQPPPRTPSPVKSQVPPAPPAENCTATAVPARPRQGLSTPGGAGNPPGFLPCG